MPHSSCCSVQGEEAAKLFFLPVSAERRGRGEKVLLSFERNRGEEGRHPSPPPSLGVKEKAARREKEGREGMRRRILSRSQQARRDRRRPLCSRYQEVLHACREKEKFSYSCCTIFLYMMNSKHVRMIPSCHPLSTVCSHCLIAKK